MDFIDNYLDNDFVSKFVILKNKAGLVRPATEAHAEEAIQALKTGKVIAVPTDTLYGFACDAWYHHLILFFLFRL